MATRDEMSSQRRAAVLKATAQLLDEVGITGLTLRQVAEKAQVGLGTLFFYAANKDDLLMQVYGPRMDERWTAILDASEGLPALDRIDQYFAECLDIYFADKENVREFYFVSLKTPVAQWEWLERLRDRLGYIVFGGQQAGDITDGVDVGVLTSMFLGAYWVAISESYRDDLSERRTREVVQSALAVLRRGVQAK